MRLVRSYTDSNKDLPGVNDISAYFLISGVVAVICVG